MEVKDCQELKDLMDKMVYLVKKGKKEFQGIRDYRGYKMGMG